MTPTPSPLQALLSRQTAEDKKHLQLLRNLQLLKQLRHKEAPGQHLKEQMMRGARKCALINDKAGWEVSQYAKFCGPRPEEEDSCQAGDLDDRLLRYFRMSEPINRRQGSPWLFRRVVQFGVKLVLQLQQDESGKRENAICMVLYNNAVAYSRLQMYRQSCNCLVTIGNLTHSLKPDFQVNCKALQTWLDAKMGVEICLPEESQKQIEVIRDHFVRCVKEVGSILSMTKEQFEEFMETLNYEGQQMCLYSYFNLAIQCKQRGYFQQAASILQCIVSKEKTRKCLKLKIGIVLAQVYSELGRLSHAYAILSKLEVEDKQKRLDVGFQLRRLKEEIKISQATKTEQPDLSKNFRYVKMEQLQQELYKLTGKQPLLKKKKIDMNSYQSSKDSKVLSKATSRTSITRATEHKTARMNQQNMRNTSMRNTHIKASNLRKTNLRKSHLKSSIAAKPMLRSFRSTLQVPMVEGLMNGLNRGRRSTVQIVKSIHSVEGALQGFEDKISMAIKEGRFKDAQQMVEEVGPKLQSWQHESPHELYPFLMTMLEWLPQLPKPQPVCAMLRSLASHYKQPATICYRTKILTELMMYMERVGDFKNALFIASDLQQLDGLQHLLKTGQLYLRLESYSQAITVFELYAKRNPGVEALLKLVHAYTKVPSFNRKAQDILNNLLFEQPCSLTFRQEIIDASYMEQGVLLLANIYLNTAALKRGQQLCQAYLKRIFNSHEVVHLLGLMQLRQGLQKQAYQNFLRALRLKENYQPALIELSQLLNLPGFSRYHAIPIFQKAFLSSHRSWDMLMVFMKVASPNPLPPMTLSPESLLACANILQEVQGMEMEAQAAYMWALEEASNIKKRGIDEMTDLLNQIYMKLGQITLEKGNYRTSQRYFQQLLEQLQAKKMYLSAKRDMNEIQLKALVNLMFICLQQGKIDKSIQLFEQVALLPIKTFRKSKHRLNNQIHQKLPYQISSMLFRCQDEWGAINRIDSFCKELQKNFGDDSGFDDKVAQTWWQVLMVRVAEAHESKGRTKQAKKAYQQVVLKTMSQEGSIGLSKLYIKLGDLEKAREVRRGVAAFHA